MDCVGFDGYRLELLSLECNTTHLAVCQIDRATCGDVLVEDYENMCSSLALPEMLTATTLIDLFSNFHLTNGDYIQLSNYPNELLVTQVSANTTTEITTVWYSIQISGDSSEERKIFVWTIPYYETAFYYYESNFISVANLKIDFLDYYVTEENQCVHLTPDGYWSTEGLETSFSMSNRTIQCTTKIQNISAITVGIFIIPEEIRISLISLTAIIYFISLLLLVSSVIIFIASGKKFFSHDINILHFNNTLSLLTAFLSVAFLPLPYYYSQSSCIPVSFLLHFLWTSIFLSSLSIAIVVFYSIWIVSINHTARKLSKYFIPIGWGVSLLWAAGWTSIRHFVLVRDSSMYYCFYTSGLKLEIDFSFLCPMIAILLINTALLLASLVKVWLVLRKQSGQEGELKRLRKVIVSGILLVPALGLPFISVIAILIYEAPAGTNRNEQNILTFLIIILINSPIGIIHFILITCQIRETIIRRYCCCCRVTPAKIAHSLHLNIVRPRPKQENNDIVIANPTVQQSAEP